MHNSDIQNWLARQFGHTRFSVVAIAGDASPRRYYRVQAANHSFIVLSSPQPGSVLPFLQVREVLQDIGLSVPMLFVHDAEQGLLLLSDLGRIQYGDRLQHAREADRLYRQAFYPIIWMQRYLLPQTCALQLNSFSIDFMLKQCELFTDWYLKHHLHRHVTADLKQELQDLLQQITKVVSEQPLVFSHMDYHSRNLMVLKKNHAPGILDFQDAMWAPCTLDLVSLLKDCYIAWPREQVLHWVKMFFCLKQKESPGALAVDFPTFLKWFDWTGVQRYIRILGTFSRLHYAYGKSAYLQYIPRILKELREMAQTYPALRPLERFLR
jgi:N-acetylmuramate 1-kinase